jgi:hypothetical protein
MKTFFLTMLLSLSPLLAQAESINIDLTLPTLEVSPYHRPYVAVWLETTDRRGIETIAAWYEKDDWLKDMRQWWRKLGKSNPKRYDAVSGATRKPGKHHIQWTVIDSQGKPIPKGEYYLCLEAAREAGGRDFLRQKITLGNRETQTYSLNGDIELGEINITIHP